MNALDALHAWLERLDLRHGWIKYAALAAFVAGVAALATPTNPPVPAGTPGILELQVAGTHETVASLLASADRAVVARALAWDYLLIALYALGLPLLLMLFRPAGEASRWDRHAPWLPVAAGLLDVAENVAVHIELARPVAEVGDWLPAIAASSCLASWTLLVMAASRLGWLILRRILRLGPVPPAQVQAPRS